MTLMAVGSAEPDLGSRSLCEDGHRDLSMMGKSSMPGVRGVRVPLSAALFFSKGAKPSTTFVLANPSRRRTLDVPSVGHFEPDTSAWCDAFIAGIRHYFSCKAGAL